MNGIIENLDSQVMSLLKDLDDLEEAISWGLKHRKVRKPGPETPYLLPRPSPMDNPFKVNKSRCRRRRTHRKCNVKSLPSSPFVVSQRDAMTHNEYTDMLSVPNSTVNEEYFISNSGEQGLVKNKKGDSRKLQRCSPRVKQMSLPNRRLVFATWKDYKEVLPPEVILRLDNLLKSNNETYLSPKEAKCYFKQLDRECRKEKQRKTGMKCIGMQDSWVKTQIQETAKAFVDFTWSQPFPVLTYKEGKISDELLAFALKHKALQKKKRSLVRRSRKPFVRGAFEISDKVAKVVYFYANYIDLIPISSREEVSALILPSLQNSLLFEGEEEEEYEDDYEDDGTFIFSKEGYGVMPNLENEYEDGEFSISGDDTRKTKSTYPW